MKFVIGCLSDSHGNVERCRRAVLMMGNVAAVLHGGDNFHDAEVLAADGAVDVFGVVGNCDYGVDGPSERLVEVRGQRIFLTHGHQYRVKRRLDMLGQRAKELGARICVFGHTHRSLVELKDGVLFVNPGSISRPRAPQGKSFAVIEFEGDKPDARIVELGDDDAH